MARPSKPIVHQSVALILCDAPSYLEEMLVLLELDEVPHQRVGGRGLLLPRAHLAAVRDKLHAQGIYPAQVRPLSLPEKGAL